MTVQNKNNQKVITSLLIILNALFLAYWFILAFNSRLHFDDLHFLWRIKEHSILDYIHEMYMTRSGRFIGYLQNAIHSKLIIWTGKQWFIPMSYYAIGISMCWVCVAERFKIISRGLLFLSILFIYNIYVLTNIDFAVFTWVCATSYYIMGPALCLLIHYLNKKELSKFQWLVLTLITLFIGGGNEAFTPMVLLVMFVNGLILWKKYDWDVRQTWSDNRIKKIVFTAIVLLVLFAIVIVAPGNYARLEEAHSEAEYARSSGIIPFFVAMCKAVVTYSYFMAFYIPYYLVIGVLGFYCGTKSNSSIFTNRGKIAVVMIAAYFVYTAASIIPTAFIYNGFGIQRTYTHNVFFLVALFAAVGYILGCGKEKQKSSYFLATGLAALCIVMVFNLCTDTKTAINYANAVDERAALLENHKQHNITNTVFVKPFPHPYTTDIKWNVLTLLGKESSKPVLFYESDTGIEPNEYESHYKRYHQLPFDFVIDPKYLNEP